MRRAIHDVFDLGLALVVSAGRARPVAAPTRHRSRTAARSGGTGGRRSAVRRRRRRRGAARADDHCGDVNQAIDPTAVIDDMEAPDYTDRSAQAARSGAWWAGGDAKSPRRHHHAQRRRPRRVDPGRALRQQVRDARHRAGLHRSGPSLSVSMGWGSVDGGAEGLLPNNNDFRTGLTFWARIGDTSSNKVRLAISDKYSRPRGRLLRRTTTDMSLACYDTHGVDLTQLRYHLEAVPHPVRRPHPAQLRPAAAAGRPGQHLHDRVPVRAVTPFDFWVDDIAFY